ncbi:hypothetical protein EM20IM_04000 [Candidatus Methylacidiphilum infernorum]|uniref:Uncharacterized protein n=1 Tax=Candidatus Methylacidiphilum infernorum TaxID=511746 RepID=A0ABX7PXP2_9BACT|nr:hypothetical protein [Candidatus Methylacidiphilum infernorum]QSR87493.1 hypothetical protein EM20IM_04000 [Candidatus Methylacidiphilum infernorum]
MAMELIDQGLLLHRSSTKLLRLDIARRYPEVAYADRCGFLTAVNVLGTTPEFQFILQAVLQDGSKVQIGLIKGYRKGFTPAFQPNFKPLMVTSLCLTGTTWNTAFIIITAKMNEHFSWIP